MLPTFCLLKIPVRSQQRKHLVHKIRLGGWSPVGPWGPFLCFFRNSLPFSCGEEHLQQLLTIIVKGVSPGRALVTAALQSPPECSPGRDSSIAPTTIGLYTETPEKTRKENRDNAGTDTNTETEDKQTDRQTSADNTESFLLRQTPSCFTAGARIHTGLPAPDAFLLHSRGPDSHWTSCARRLPAS